MSWDGGRSRSGAMIVGFRNGDRITRVSPDIYTVERILKHRRCGHGYQYYVLWEGYPITEASWEPESAFSADGDVLQGYKQ